MKRQKAENKFETWKHGTWNLKLGTSLNTYTNKHTCKLKHLHTKTLKHSNTQTPKHLNAALNLVQLLIQAILTDQLLVITSLDDAALLDDNDLVGMLDGAQAVCDDNRGTVFH